MREEMQELERKLAQAMAAAADFEQSNAHTVATEELMAELVTTKQALQEKDEEVRSLEGWYAQSMGKLEQTRNDLEQTRNELEQTRNELDKTQDDLRIGEEIRVKELAETNVEVKATAPGLRAPSWKEGWVVRVCRRAAENREHNVSLH